MLSKTRRKKLQAMIDRDYNYRSYRDDDVETRKGRKKGWGLFAVRQFTPGELVTEIHGQLLRERVYEGSEYAMELDEGWLLEPRPPGAFANHSCNPNTEAIQLTESTMGIVALCNIEPGTEICFDYGWAAQDWIPKCHCKAPNCRGWVVAAEELGKMRKIAAAEKAKKKTNSRKKKSQKAKKQRAS